MAQYPWLQFLFSLIHPSHCCHSPLIKIQIQPDHVLCTFKNLQQIPKSNRVKVLAQHYLSLLISTIFYMAGTSSHSKVLCLYAIGLHENLNQMFIVLKSTSNILILFQIQTTKCKAQHLFFFFLVEDSKYRNASGRIKVENQCPHRPYTSDQI